MYRAKCSKNCSKMKENVSSGSDDDIAWLLWQTNQTQDLKVIGPINAAFMLLFFLVGVPWNLLVIGVIVKKKLFTRPSVMLMLNLAIVNLLVCLLVMPFTIFFGVSVDFKNAIAMRDFFLANEVCQSGILLTLLASASSMAVALMAVDRALYLKKPLTCENLVTPKRMFSAHCDSMDHIHCNITFATLGVRSSVPHTSIRLHTCNFQPIDEAIYFILLAVVLFLLTVM